MANDIVVRIGAVLDPRSFDVVIGEIERRAKQAEQAVSRMRGASGRGGGGTGYGSNGSQQYGPSRRDIERAIAAQERLQSATEKKQTSEHDKAERIRTAQTIRELKARVQAEASLQRQRSAALNSQYKREESANAAHLAAMSRAEQTASRRREREVDRFATRTSHRATRFFFPPPEGALGVAKRVGLDLARGAGVDLSLGGGIARARERETEGMAIAQQERIASKGQTRGGAAWVAQATEIGTNLKADPTAVLASIGAFTAKTGDFENASKMIAEIGAMSLASGADLGEMGSAAGFVFNQLNGVENAGQLTIDVMRGIVGQTAVGAVEMEDYAKQMGRIAASARKFKGDTGENIKKLSALAQLSVASGGATGAADAARAVGAFVNTFGKEARINAFANQGVALFEDQKETIGKRGKKIISGTKMRDPFEIIIDSIKKTKGDVPLLANLYADTLGRKPVTAIANAYLKAGGPAADEKVTEKAMRDELELYSGAVMDATTQTANLADREKTTGTKAQAFQNSLDNVTSKMAQGLLPSLEKLAPVVIQFASKMSDLVQWASANPFKAVVLAMTASVARAGIESGIRLILDRAATSLLGGVASGAVGALPGAVARPGVISRGGAAVGGARPGVISRGGAAVGGALSGGMGTVANSLNVAGIAVASFMITDAVLNSANTTVQESRARQATSGNEIVDRFTEEYSAAKTPEEQAAAVQRAQFNLEQDESSRGVTDKLFGNSDIYFKSMRALRDRARGIDERRQAGTEQQQYQASTGQSTLASDIGIAVARELTGIMQKPGVVRVSNPEDFKFSSIGGGMSFDKPPREAL